MCLGIPGELVEVLPGPRHLAVAEIGGVRRTVDVGLLDPDELRTGAWVLVHVGFALAVIDEDEAASTLRMLEGSGDAYSEELAALSATSPGPAPAGPGAGEAPEGSKPLRP
jgi:hydrogenase expression/formation protein HypC